jgi:Rifampin ADP-ribosyl transferase
MSEAKRWYHGTSAELRPGDLIEPRKYPPSHKDAESREPRDHAYFSNRLQYITEHYGPNVYEIEPTGPATHDPEYRHPGMRRSEYPLRVVRRVS